MNISFVGKTALVTGAGKGMGRETVKLLAKCGANVIALTRSQSDLDSLKKEIPSIKTICADLVNLDETIKAVEAAGHIDLLVNNAALVDVGSAMDVTKERMEKTMLVNVIAPLQLSQVVARKLIKEGKGGAIVNVSSTVSRIGQANHFPYACSKSAVDSLTIALAAELAPHKIRVNGLLPGGTNTNLVKPVVESNPDVLSSITARIPMGRLGEPQEMAQTIVFLLSDKASYITGAHVVADGGYLIN